MLQETSLVRLAMNALQGLESSLISIDKLCKVFRSDLTDRTFHRIPSLWNQSVSTLALEKILTSLGCMGCEVFFLRKFINHFTSLNWDDATLRSNEQTQSEAGASDHPPYSLVNQAFAVAVRDILEGYIAALDTISSSVALRRSSNNDNMSSRGCLSTVAHSEVTLLEVYLHTKELRNQIEVIGSICNVHNVARCFSLSPLEDLDTQTKFSDFPRGGNLLTYLYMELKVSISLSLFFARIFTHLDQVSNSVSCRLPCKNLTHNDLMHANLLSNLSWIDCIALLLVKFVAWF